MQSRYFLVIIMYVVTTICVIKVIKAIRGDKSTLDKLFEIFSELLKTIPDFIYKIIEEFKSKRFPEILNALIVTGFLLAALCMVLAGSLQVIVKGKFDLIIGGTVYFIFTCIAFRWSTSYCETLLSQES